jgi:hypothetical protein
LDAECKFNARNTSLSMLQIQCKFNARNTSWEEDDVYRRLPQPGSVCLFDMPSPSSYSSTCQIYGNLWFTHCLHSQGSYYLLWARVQYIVNSLSCIIIILKYSFGSSILSYSRFWSLILNPWFWKSRNQIRGFKNQVPKITNETK